IAAGATIVATPGNEPLVRAFAAAPLRDGVAPKARLSIEVMKAGRGVLGDATQRLELIDIGPNAHAKEMVVAYLPRHRVVFQADVGPDGANDVAQEATIDFARALTRLGLAVERIVPVHGGASTLRDLENAVARAGAR